MIFAQIWTSVEIKNIQSYLIPIFDSISLHYYQYTITIIPFMHALLLIFLLIRLCYSLAPIKIEKLGSASKYIYRKFTMIDDRDEKQYESFLSTPSTRILANLFNNFPKTQPAIQIVSLSDRGLYELLLLTQPNNFENQIIVLKDNPIEYAWLRKNAYLNGLEEQFVLLHAGLGDRNMVFEAPQGDWTSAYRFVKTSKCKDCEILYRVETNISQIISYPRPKGKGKPEPNSIHLLMQIRLLQYAKQLRRQLRELHKKGKTIHAILSLGVAVPTLALLPNISAMRIYNVGLKIDGKMASIQFRQLTKQSRSDKDNDNVSPDEFEFEILGEGVYYLTNGESIFRNQ